MLSLTHMHSPALHHSCMSVSSPTSSVLPTSPVTPTSPAPPTSPALPSLQVVPIAHPSLQDVLDPVLELYEDVKRKALLRLEYENLTKCEAITAPTSKYYQKPAEYAINRYAYYVCYKCNKVLYVVRLCNDGSVMWRGITGCVLCASSVGG